MPEELLTHEVVAAKLRALKEAGSYIDVSKLTRYEHKALGLSIFVGAMAYKAHKEWQDVRRFEDLQHVTAGKSDVDPKDRSRSDRILLTYAVYTEDGKPLGSELAGLLLELEGAGPDNYTLLSEAERANPPRELLVSEVAQMLNKSQLDAMLWRILFEAGLGKVLIDAMAPSSTPEELEWAKHEIGKCSEVVFALSALFDAEDAADRIGVTFREGINLIAMYGSAEAAVEAEKESDNVS